MGFRALLWSYNCGKMRNCSERAISHFATMFLTLFNNLTLIYGEFLNIVRMRSKVSAAEKIFILYQLIKNKQRIISVT